MNAGDSLRQAGLDSAVLRAVLHPVVPERVVLLPAPTWMRIVWGSGTGAMTLGRRVFVRQEILHGDPRALARLVVHELVHVRQWSDYGPVGFLRRYLGRYLSGLARGLGHRGAYRSNPYESEAREVAELYGHTV